MNLRLTRMNDNDRIFMWLSLLFFLTTMTVPSTYRVLRFAVTLCWAGFSFATLQKMHCSGRLLYAFLFFLVSSIISFCWGVLNRAPGALPCLKPYVLWPIVFLVISTQINSLRRLRMMTRMLLYIEFAICLMDIWYCFSVLGILPAYPSILSNISMGFNFNPYMLTMRFSTHHVCTHIFMIPFTLALVIDDFFSGKNNWKLILLLCCEMVALYLSGRIALWISVAAAAVLLFVLRRLQAGHNLKYRIIVRRMVFILIVLLIVLLIGLRYQTAASNAIKAITRKITNSFTQNDSIDSTRKTQSEALISGWLYHILIGNGLGSYTPESIRSDSSPWEYEMSYHYTLFQGGLLGMAALVCFLFTIAKTLWAAYQKKKLSHDDTIPYLLGFFSIVVATSVEPYLFKLGTMWMVFVPFSIGWYSESLPCNQIERGNAQ